AQVRIGRPVAPRVGSGVSVNSAVGGALPLRFGRERLPCPARIRTGFRMTDINRPVQGQRHFVEHSAAEPLRTFLAPEQGMRNSASGLPVPIVVGPECTRLITTGSDELEVLAVSHLVAINLERWNVDRVRFILVVPAKVFGTASQTERHRPSRNHDWAGNDWVSRETQQ